MTARCNQCGCEILGPPMSYAAEPPWRVFGITEADFARRVELTNDVCGVDGQHFLVRGRLEIPVRDHAESFSWSVWCSLSPASFQRMMARWHDADRAHDEPMFGWLLTELPCYPETLNTKTMVHTRPPGHVPFVEAHPESPLGKEQVEGISMERVQEFAAAILGHVPRACACGR